MRRSLLGLGLVVVALLVVWVVVGVRVGGRDVALWAQLGDATAAAGSVLALAALGAALLSLRVQHRELEQASVSLGQQVDALREGAAEDRRHRLATAYAAWFLALRSSLDDVERECVAIFDRRKGQIGQDDRKPLAAAVRNALAGVVSSRWLVLLFESESRMQRRIDGLSEAFDTPFADPNYNPERSVELVEAAERMHVACRARQADLDRFRDDVFHRLNRLSEPASKLFSTSDSRALGG